MANKKLYLPGEIELENAVRIIACLVDKLGGEVVIDRKHYESMEDVEVMGRNLGPYATMIYLREEDEYMEIDLSRDPDLGL